MYFYMLTLGKILKNSIMYSFYTYREFACVKILISTDFVEKVYFVYFSVRFGDQDKSSTRTCICNEGARCSEINTANGARGPRFTSRILLTVQRLLTSR